MFQHPNRWRRSSTGFATMRISTRPGPNTSSAVSATSSRATSSCGSNPSRTPLQAMSVGFADRMRRMREELEARDTTVSSITRYFEALVADLTDRADRDPKTRLMNFQRFIERLEAFIALEQRGTWCAVGLADIRSFKSYNDAFGHALGDRVIDRVARLLREQVRANDLLAQESRRGSAARTPCAVRRRRVLLPDPETGHSPGRVGRGRAVSRGRGAIRLVGRGRTPGRAASRWTWESSA